MTEILQLDKEGEPNQFSYQSVVECLIWISKTRSDIVYAVSHVVRYMSRHTAVHKKSAMKILGYLLKYLNFRVGFLQNGGATDKPIPVGISTDSSWANVLPGRESFNGYTSHICGMCFQARSRITPYVCSNVHEAKYYSWT
jgi:hypothetical protein